jgi:hypothetical protein
MIRYAPTQTRDFVAAGSKRNRQDARSNYERYLALARTQALSGDMIAAENYYQHAEHYFRSMSPKRAANLENRAPPLPIGAD